MSEAKNNEVDVMLRSLARRHNSSLQQSGASGNGEQISAEHLDADELNAYAEGVLPAAARARYTQHLADCAVCRGLIVGLSQSVPSPHAATPQTHNFWQRLTSLFSPAVLRFAVPVLLLTAVIGVTLIALRDRSGKDFVAKNEGPAAPASAPAGSDHVQPNTTPSVTAPTSSNGPVSIPKVEPSTKPLGYDDEKAKQVAEEKAPARETSEFAAKDAATPTEPSGTFSGSGLAQPKAAPAPQVLSDNDKTDALTRGEKREDQRQRDEANRVQDIHGPNRAATQQNAAPMNGRSVGGLSSERPVFKKNAEVESRNVAGRTFVREGDAWIDTAYESSHSLTRVTRGSEQYRALVADEPALRTIAEQLDGVVIVVWKGRSYRIQ